MGAASDDDFDLFYLVGDFIHILCKRSTSETETRSSTSKTTKSSFSKSVEEVELIEEKLKTSRIITPTKNQCHISL